MELFGTIWKSFSRDGIRTQNAPDTLAGRCPKASLGVCWTTSVAPHSSWPSISQSFSIGPAAGGAQLVLLLSCGHLWLSVTASPSVCRVCLSVSVTLYRTNKLPHALTVLHIPLFLPLVRSVYSVADPHVSLNYAFIIAQALWLRTWHVSSAYYPSTRQELSRSNKRYSGTYLTI